VCDCHFENTVIEFVTCHIQCSILIYYVKQWTNKKWFTTIWTVLQFLQTVILLYFSWSLIICSGQQYLRWAQLLQPTSCAHITNTKETVPQLIRLNFVADPALIIYQWHVHQNLTGRRELAKVLKAMLWGNSRWWRNKRPCQLASVTISQLCHKRYVFDKYLCLIEAK